ncbi:adenosine deaminase [Legionella geestiana]|uniref:adenosine deaminase family protein n=1 Tax=Legionella geestiana TaxID=45065 RepID=UPI001092D100|nr:adenosine deaminase [Legionella geestiana]QDQ40459.1 adenosine deaminase [Legionella geestiana]
MKRLLFTLLTLSSTVTLADVNTHFNTIRNNPAALYAFLKEMPKGGELHYHLSGGAYPEAMIDTIRPRQYCLDAKTMNLQEYTDFCNGEDGFNITRDQQLRDKAIRAWSLKDFVPGEESAHDHFFASFYRFGPIVSASTPQLLGEVMKTAANQNELYMEVMVMPDNGKSMEFASRIQGALPLEKKADILLTDPRFQDNIRNVVADGPRILEQTRALLGCDKSPAPPACSVNVKFIYYALRGQSEDSVFAAALTAFATASQSDEYVGVNLVQAEDGLIATRDYRKHMDIMAFLRKKYPNVHLSLHAGELGPEDAAPESLRFHIHDAVHTARAERIGHGTDIAFENDSNALAAHMAKNGIAVEVNLTSNRKLLGVHGKQHPLRYYLSSNVPVVLSTDDEGVLRTDLTREYLAAVREHGLDYKTLRTLTRNALTYSFLKGKSLFSDPEKGTYRSECTTLDSHDCDLFVSMNPKAQLQRELERRLEAFEARFR